MVWLDVSWHQKLGDATWYHQQQPQQSQQQQQQRRQRRQRRPIDVFKQICYFKPKKRDDDPSWP